MAIIPLASSLLAALLGAKLVIGRRAKHIDIFDRTAKEVAVRDVILKLKLAAAEPSPQGQFQQIAAKATAYQQAENLETQLAEELAALAPKARPGLEWMRNASYQQILIPKPLYDGKTGLSWSRKILWWPLLVIFYFSLLAYFFAAYVLYGFLVSVANTQQAIKDPRSFFTGLCGWLIFSFCSLLVSSMARRAAYWVTLDLKQSPVPSGTAGTASRG